MADEQTILLGSEEELTSVRERLERTQARRIILVIPQQTQLRSHVGWRLIHARMRELGKELLVISPDRQVRALARAAGFKVAESQEAPSNRPRLGSSGTRPGGINTRGAGRSRIGASRGGPESKPSQQGARRRFTPSASNKPMTRPSAPARPEYEDEDTLERQGRAGTQAHSGQPIAPVRIFEEPEESAGTTYTFGIRTTPSVRPSLPGRDEEEELKPSYEDDYHTAQSILRAAREGSRPANNEEPTSQREWKNTTPTAQSRASDPYAFMEDDQQLAPLPEQKGSAPGRLAEIGTGIPDITERPTEIMASEIEDLGDMGNVDLPEILPEQEPDELQGRLRELPRRSRPLSGQMPPSARRSPRAPRPGTQGLDDDDDELLAISDRMTRESPRPSRGLAGAGQRVSQPMAPRPGMHVSQPIRLTAQPQAGTAMRSSPASQKPPGRQLMPGPAPISRQQPAGTQRGPQKNNRGLAIAIAALVLLLLGAFALFYFVPTATITLSLQGSTFNQAVQLNASAKPLANSPNSVQAQILEHDFSASGQGTASGTTRVGNAKAQGFVTFTNSGGADVTIPSQTIIVTQSGIQFATSAEAVVLHGSTLPVPVTAQQSGDSGNVDADSITTIPQTSLRNIAQRSGLSPTAVTAQNLTVKNAKGTSGGGATNVPSPTQHDLQALASTLHQKLQQEVKAWLATQMHTGDIRGKLQPDVLASSGPLNEEQLNATPQVGQPASSGTVAGSLSLHISLLVARATAVQTAAGKLLNTAALKLRPAKMLATRLPVVLAHIHSTPSKDGSTLTISADASGKVIPLLDTNAIASSVTSKWVSQAESDLKNGVGVQNLIGVQNVQISVSPGFLSILPLQAGRIHVILQPVQEAPPPPIKNGTTNG
ncbi:MAG TPA: baseplate J/gp47 family protein [Ktedonobacteraceae bacterium]|nr:baseplate J/gp47 family protein [Ktedonobacteraceae bacterium]